MHSVNSIMIYRTVVKPYFVSIFTYSRNQCISVSGRRRGRQLQFSTLLVGEERARALQKLTAPGGPFTWMEDPSGRNAITKTYHFTDFAQAWKWMSQVALMAEEMNHHPEWKNIYNMVEVTLSTHDCGGLSELDFKMAEHMDSYAATLLPIRDLISK